MEFNGVSNEIQSGRLFKGEIQEIPSKVLLTFWGGVINPNLALICIQNTSQYFTYFTSLKISENGHSGTVASFTP